jgi:hypothetical protein
MRSIIYLTLATLVLLLAACSGSPAGSTSTAQPTQSNGTQATQVPEPTQAPQSDPAQPTGQPAGQDVIIALQKTGGIAGINETLTVHADGTITVNGRGGNKEARIATTELGQLQQLLASPDFANLEGSYPATGADLITYRLTISEGGAQRTIVTMDGAQNPAVLDQVLAELAKLQAQAK